MKYGCLEACNRRGRSTQMAWISLHDIPRVSVKPSTPLPFVSSGDVKMNFVIFKDLRVSKSNTSRSRPRLFSRINIHRHNIQTLFFSLSLLLILTCPATYYAARRSDRPPFVSVCVCAYNIYDIELFFCSSC